MKTGTDGYTHFRKLEVVGEVSDAGSGIQLEPAATAVAVGINAIGDAADVPVTLKSKGVGNLGLNVGTVNRAIFNGTKKALTDASATALFEVPLATLEVAAGFMIFAIVCGDAADRQVISGIATYSAENKAGTLVGVMTYDAANEAKSVSSGTLTIAFTDDDNADAARFLVQTTGSLTETVNEITYTVFPLIGTVTIL
jgi:hypothetical protein